MSQTTQQFQIGDLVTFNNDYQNESARVDAVDYKWDAWHYFVVTDSKGLGYWTNGGKLSLNKSYADIIAERAAKQAEFANAPTYDFDLVFEANKKLDALTVSFPKALKYSDIKFNIDNIISLTLNTPKEESKEDKLPYIDLFYEGDKYVLEYGSEDDYNSDSKDVLETLATIKSNNSLIDLLGHDYFYNTAIIKSIEKETFSPSRYDSARQSVKLMLPEFKEFLTSNEAEQEFFNSLVSGKYFPNKVDRDIFYNEAKAKLEESKKSNKNYPKFLTFGASWSWGGYTTAYINRDYINIVKVGLDDDKTNQVIIKTIFPYANFVIFLGYVSKENYETRQSELATKINNTIQGTL